ncbi:MAG: hypothetical protein CMB99_16095 [Flavobacteriaceae bacterium]|jgi:uncharacterized Fe-S cluster-containing radical SAM superfamily enzyme|nr:hypothetical protein [Flavobacteriaceae bacterium]|tara:strand:+ start:30820 stop:31035 length:216 start_codon:yes stop_codon:yes gene_type:complete
MKLVVVLTNRETGEIFDVVDKTRLVPAIRECNKIHATMGKHCRVRVLSLDSETEQPKVEYDPEENMLQVAQ